MDAAVRRPAVARLAVLTDEFEKAKSLPRDQRIEEMSKIIEETTRLSEELTKLYNR